MLGFWDWNTQTQTENMDIVKHLESYDSSNHHVGHLKKRALRGWGDVLQSFYYKIKLRFPQPIMRGPQGWDGFHLVFSPGIRVQIENTLPSSLLSIQYQISSHTVQTSPALILPPLGIPRHKMRFIIIYVVGHKITKTNCSWHKFFKLLFFLKLYLSVAFHYKYPQMTNRTTPLFGFVEV